MYVLYQKKYPFVFLGIMTLTVIVFLITIDFMYGQSSGQTNTIFKTYENDIHKIKMGYSSNKKLENENSTSIDRFIAPGTNHKYTVARTKVAKPIRLSLSPVPQSAHVPCDAIFPGQHPYSRPVRYGCPR